MAKRLTDLAIKNLKATADRREVPDGGARGLFVIVQPTGRRGFAVRYRLHGRPAKLTLPSGLSLAEARASAARIYADLEKGVDPAAAKRSEKHTAALQAADSIEAMVHRFLEEHTRKRNRPATIQQVESIFTREVLPRWKGRSVHSIRKGDVVRLLDAIASDRPIRANRALAHVRKFFNFLISKDVMHTLSPCMGVEAPAKEKSRERVLSRDEIAELWRACDQLGHPIGPVVKVLLLTAQRRNEVFFMRRSEIDFAKRVWILPSGRTKNNRVHSVPLSKQVMAIIESCKTGDDLVFPTINSGHAKVKIDALMQARERWTFHDLRRSAITYMADDLNVPPHICEAVINHAGGMSRVASIYNRASYLAEKIDAVQGWSDLIDSIVDKGRVADNVRVLRRG